MRVICDEIRWPLNSSLPLSSWCGEGFPSVSSRLAWTSPRRLPVSSVWMRTSPALARRARDHAYPHPDRVVDERRAKRIGDAVAAPLSRGRSLSRPALVAMMTGKRRLDIDWADDAAQTTRAWQDVRWPDRGDVQKRGAGLRHNALNGALMAE